MERSPHWKFVWIVAEGALPDPDWGKWEGISWGLRSLGPTSWNLQCTCVDEARTRSISFSVHKM